MIPLNERLAVQILINLNKNRDKIMFLNNYKQDMR